VALVDGDARAADRMTALGVDAVADAAAPLGDLVATVLALADAEAPMPRPASPTPASSIQGPGLVDRAVSASSPTQVPGAAPDVPSRGRVIAVWGPTGAPGRTTVAVNLAAELAALAHDPTGTAPPAGRRPGPSWFARGSRTGARNGAAAGSSADGKESRGENGVVPGVRTPDAEGALTRRAADRAAGPARDPAPDGPGGALLIDADTYGGTVAQVVGLLDEAPGIAAAARAAGQGSLDARSLARLTPVIGPGLRVLTGISRADRWPELPASSLDVVWERARVLATWVVVDCGFSLEQDEVLSYDTHAPRRNAATLSALDAADVVVVVGAGDPVGVQRLVRGLAELTESGVGSDAERVVVVNRVRASAAGPRPEHAVADALERYAGVTGAHLLPDDRSGVDAALLTGGTLAESAPQSPVRAAIARLAADLAGVPARSLATRRRRGLRSAVRT
jgi:MinD-like ATPase involved in chromosome partitioning or flagellar assembly